MALKFAPDRVCKAARYPGTQLVSVRPTVGFMIPFLAVAERAKKRGELAPGQNPSEFVASIFSPFFYQRWFSREPLDEAFVKSVVGGLVGHQKRN